MFDRNVLSLSIVFTLVSMAFLVAFTGCGSVTLTPAVGTVSMTASANTVDGTDSVLLNATVNNDRSAAGVTWETSAGTLSASTLSSTTFTAPAATGSQQTVIITAKSAADTTKTATMTITVPAAPAVASLTNTQQAVSVGTAYSITLAGSGGISPYKGWTLAKGSGPLPSCLKLSSSGVLSSVSTPSASCVGVYPGIIFAMTDSGTTKALDGRSLAQTITVTGPSITLPASLPAGQVGSAYAASAAATGALGAVMYSLASGVLPPGLSLNTSTGTISGTPKVSDLGTDSFSVKAIDDFGDVATSGDLSIVVYSALSLPTPDPASFPSIGYVGLSYNDGNGGVITGTGGSGNLSITVADSGLPANGLIARNSGATLTVTGTPVLAATLPYTITFGLTLTDNTTKNSITQSGYSLTVESPSPVTLPETNPSSLGSALAGQGYTGAINLSGGVPPYIWSIGGTQIGSTCYSLGNGTMCATSTGGSTLSITGAPSATDTVAIPSVKVVDAAKSSATESYTIAVNAVEPIKITLGQIPQGMVTMPFTFNALHIEGGVSPYIVTYTNAPDGLSQQSGAVSLVGTPTSSGTTTVQVKVTDSAPSQNSSSTTFNLVTVPLTIGTNNTKLKGQYACYYQQAWDGDVSGGLGKSMLSRGGSVFAFTADGAGNITNGELDSNSPSTGYRSATANGALSGTYAVGTDNRGYALISAARQRGAVVLGLTAGNLSNNGYFSELALVSMDDVGTKPSGTWGSGICYQQTTTGLLGITPSGGFASVLRGEDGSGNPTATAGFLQFGDGISSGVEDTVDNGILSAGLPSAANTFTPTDSYGRFVLTSTTNPTNAQVWYLANNLMGAAVRMSANPHNAGSNADFSIGEARAQVSSAVSTGHAIDGKVVMYFTGLNQWLSTYKAVVMQANASGGAGSTEMMINAAISNEGGTVISKGPEVGKTMTYTSDPATGRTTLSLNGQPQTGDVLYVYGPNSAAVLFGDGTPAQALAGWLEPQLAPRPGTWSIDDLSSNIFMYKVNNGDPKLGVNNSSLTSAGEDSYIGYLEDEGGEQWADWGDGLCGCAGFSVAIVPDTKLDSSTGALGLDPGGTIGIFDTQLTLNGPTKTIAMCIAVSVDMAIDSNAKGRLVCVDVLTNHPSLTIGQQ